MTVIALDIGHKRIGIAVSDASRRHAFPLETLAARPKEIAVRRILELALEREATEIVIGLPLELDGRAGGAVRRTRQFTEALDTHRHITVHEWDERMTSVAAERSLIESDVRRKKRKSVVDQVAATLILQGWLDAQQSSPQAH